MALEKRWLQPYVMNWLISHLGLGMAVGNIFYVATDGGTWETLLENNGVPDSKIYHKVSTALAVCTTNQNDVVLVTPGAHVETAEVDWSLSSTHLVGLGRPPGFSDYTMAGCHMYSTTTSVANALHVTGNNCQFINVGITNAGNNAACLYGLKLAGYGNTFRGCSMMGIMAANQISTAAAASVLIASLSSDYLFEDCVIGQNCWGARTTANQGQVYYGGTTESGLGAGNGPQNGLWRRCTFLSQGTTTTVPMIYTAPGGTEAMDRYHMFEDCLFANYSGSDAAISAVFSDGCLTWHNIILRRCTAVGYDEWQKNDLGTHPGYISADMPITGLAGGHARMPTGAHDSGT